MEIENKVIAITGAAQGLGLAMATVLASKGARIALIDFNGDKLDAAVDQCKAAGGDARAYVANVADEDNVVKTFDQIAADFGALNGLINNAGVLRDGLMLKVKDGEIVKKMSVVEWQTVIDVNLTGVFLCGREAAERMIKLGCEGVIINISSIAKDGNRGQTNYSAAKAGVAAMAVTWAKELSGFGIRSMAIAPGFVATDMVASMKPEAREKMTSGIPQKRMALPEEIGHACAYIFENDYMNGRVIQIDGGLRL